MSDTNSIEGDKPEELEAEPAPAPFEVPAVFLDANGDLAIKSSDDVLFYVYKAVLVTGSTFFRDMFQHPQPAGRTVSTHEPITWSEPATTITALLYQLYPIVKPEVDSVDQLLVMAVAADKWGMDGVMADVKARMIKPRFLDQRPMAIYSVACRLELADVKRSASRRLVELYDPLDKALYDDASRLYAQEFIALCRLRKDRISYACHVLESVFPWNCLEHGLSHNYGPWRQTLIDALTRTPSASFAASLVDLAPALTITSQCGVPLCNTSVEAGGLRMKQLLEDPDHFVETD